MLQTGRVIGMPVTVGSTVHVAERIIREAHAGHDGYVCVANVHMVSTAMRDEKLRQIIGKALLVTADGLPLVWILKRNGFKEAERVTGTDLTLKLCERTSVEGMAVGFYGGSPETIRRLQKLMTERFSALKVAFCESPPLLPVQPEVDQDIVKRINESGAHIVFVGLGCPKQEFWMMAYKPYLSATLIGVGAAFDFLAGTAKRAPVWMQRYGFEWLHRLAVNPRKTLKRYVMTNPPFIWMVIKECVKRRKLKNSSF